jgi:hypothetical protein
MNKFTISFILSAVLVLLPVTFQNAQSFNSHTHKSNPKDNINTARTWIGAGSGGAGTDFNTAANWSPSGVPGALDDLTMNITGSTTVTLSGNITVNSLSITYTASTNTNFTLDAIDFSLTTNGDFTATNTSSGSGNRQLTFHVGTVAGVSTGALIIKGNAVFSTTGTKAITLTSNQTSRARYEFQGDVTMGSLVSPSAASMPYRYVFSKPSGVQTLTINCITPFSFSAVEIGNKTTSTPTLTLAGSSYGKLAPSARCYLAIYAGSTLDMGTKTFNDSSGIATDTLLLDNSATIKVGGTTGGLAGSNFPSGFGKYRILSNSTINFNSTAGAQTQSINGTLFNVVINNPSGVTLAGVTTINTSLTLLNGVYTIGSNLTLAGGATINRDIGSLSAAPTFGATINVTYTGTTGVTTDNELPVSTSVLNNLIINKSGGVSLIANNTVNGTLTFTSGNLSTGSNTLTLGSSGIVTGEISSSYLVGRLTTTRSIGTAASTFGNIGFEIDNGSDNIGSVTVLRISGSAGIVTVGTNSGIARTWYVTSGADPSVSGRSLTLYWVSTDDNSKDVTQAEVWREIGVSGFGEYSFIQDVTVSDPRLISTFSTANLNNTVWTVTDATEPLPVKLITFNASVSNRDISLRWSTSYEINNQGFNIERRAYGKDSYGEWKSVDFINGNGTTHETKNYSYNDKNLSTGKYQYRLKQVDFNGNSEYFALKSPSEILVGKPILFTVSQNYPNPSNPSSKIDFQLPEDSKVSLKIYDLLGKEVANLINETRQAGFYTAVFDGSNYSSGIYFYQLIAEGSTQSFAKTMKLVLVK